MQQQRRNLIAWAAVAVSVLALWHSPAPCMAQTAGALEVIRSSHQQLEVAARARLEPLLAVAAQEPGSDLFRELQSLTTTPPLGRIVVHTLPLRLRAAPQTSAEQELRGARAEIAGQLFELSRKAARAKLPWYAFVLTRRALEFDSDLLLARKALGWTLVGEQWLTPWEADRVAKKYVDHPQFGWLPADWVARYELGERNYQGRWVSVSDEATLRADIRNGWEVRTEHFLIRTNDRLETAVSLGRQLEAFHWLFRNLFVAFFADPSLATALLDPATSRPRAESQLYHLVVFRNQQQFVDALITKVPIAGQINGLYWNNDRCCYTFAENPSLTTTLFHEITHQILYESNRLARPVAVERDMWVIEGIACYMETFRAAGDVLMVGDPQDVRVLGAREQVANGIYVPFRTFTQLGMADYQNGARLDEIRQWYNQGAGLAYFLIHADDGAYRDALMIYLAQLYAAGNTPPAGPQAVGNLLAGSADWIDSQYQQFWSGKPSPGSVNAANPPPTDGNLQSP